jgi:hypothetical protein
MTETQKIWLEELIEEHRVAASNERLWAKGAPDAETAEMHEANAEEHMEFADMLQTLCGDKLYYEVWALGYNADHSANDREVFLASFDDKAAAIKYAKTIETFADIYSATPEILESFKTGEYMTVRVEECEETDLDAEVVDYAYEADIFA